MEAKDERRKGRRRESRHVLRLCERSLRVAQEWALVLISLFLSLTFSVSLFLVLSLCPLEVYLSTFFCLSFFLLLSLSSLSLYFYPAFFLNPKCLCSHYFLSFPASVPPPQISPFLFYSLSLVFTSLSHCLLYHFSSFLFIFSCQSFSLSLSSAVYSSLSILLFFLFHTLRRLSFFLDLNHSFASYHSFFSFHFPSVTVSLFFIERVRVIW